MFRSSTFAGIYIKTSFKSQKLQTQTRQQIKKQCNRILTDEKLAIKVIMIVEQYQLTKLEQDQDLNNMMSFKQKNNQC